MQAKDGSKTPTGYFMYCCLQWTRITSRCVLLKYNLYYNIIITVTLSLFGSATFFLHDNFFLLCFPAPSSNVMIRSVQWIVNTTNWEDSILKKEIGVHFSPSTNGVGAISVSNLTAHYNNTRFQCQANTTEGIEVSEILVIKLQG